jgi:nicotinamidase-related amidase
MKVDARVKHSVLIIIDVQNAIDHPSWGRRNNPEAEGNMACLLECWRVLNLPIVHVQHLSTEADSTYRPNQPGCDFKTEVTPLAGEIIVQKNVNCAFIGTTLEDYLRSHNYQHLVITGVITNNSVEATARVAGNLGFDTVVVSDATATFDKQDLNGQWHSAELVHALSLANLQGEYATIQTTEQVINNVQTQCIANSLKQDSLLRAES